MELAALLEEARSAPPDRRIEWRDRIAAHGARGIEGVRPWLADSVLAAFAVRVIERAGVNGDVALASRALRSARARVPPDVTADVTWALQRLRAATRSDAQAAAPTATPARAPRRREPPRFGAAPRRRAR